ncbi:hypothetical protein ACIRU3_04830 [Streptomyces sp. NPDC101151]|uniref:hypothetical protein n=1 Tax=Streptomyces sp. NPDC101151 TaxID=3366115 RepID=UPI00380BF177
MRKFQRAAVVAAAVAGLSTFGVGVSFAGGGYDDAPPQLTAVANSSANAVATWGGYYTEPQHEAPQEQAQAPAQAQEEPAKESAPEEGYGQYSSDGDK